jgi:dGTPase
MIDSYLDERRSGWKVRPDDARTEFEVDLSRVLHSSSFRRLGSVTQVISGEGTLHRTRLTHSLEVQQIAEGIVQRFRVNKDVPEILKTHLVDNSLVRAISLTHDLGHPPYGHAGEEALNCMMRDRGLSGSNKTYGFEGNGQTLRILTKLEDFYEKGGADLTRRTLLGILKYPIAYSDALTTPVPGPVLSETGVPLISAKDHAPPKCYLDTERDIVSWLLEPFDSDDAKKVVSLGAKSVDASLMDCSDDLAYSFADLQDAINLNLITKEHLIEDAPASLWDDYIEHSAQRGMDHLFGDKSGYERVIENLFGNSKETQRQIGRLMGYGIARTTVRARPEFKSELYAWEMKIEPQARVLVEALKKSILKRVILSPKLQHGRLQGQMSLIKVFDVLRNDPRHHLPEKQYHKYLEKDCDDRVICDWLAGSSEEFIRKLYDRIFTPGCASVSDRI